MLQSKTIFFKTYHSHTVHPSPIAFQKKLNFKIPILKQIKGRADSILSHRFPLLGEEIFLTPPPFYHRHRHDQYSKEMAYHINRTNRIYSQQVYRLLQKINPSYQPIDWQKDFKSHHRWSNRSVYKSIRLKGNHHIDVKIPWELSRFQHLSVLSLAYRESKKGEYAQEAICQILDWISTNPPQFGVNWFCTMDVAIRAANWIFWYPSLEPWIDQQPWKQELYAIFVNSLYDHLRFIPRNLERHRSFTSNHYLADIAGLLVLAIGTQSLFSDSTYIRNFCIAELQKEMLRQTYPDGTDFEASTCYHRLALELFFYATFLSVITHKEFTGKNHRQVAENIFGKTYTDRLYKMFDAVYYLIKPDGTFPQIGDNDSGQFFKLYPRAVLDMRYLLSIGGIFFQESRWKIQEFFSSPDDLAEANILFGPAGQEIWDNLSWSKLSDIPSHAFPDSGWYVMRSGNHYALISCGPIGQNGVGGHAHNDKLSFELVLNGKDIIVDPGTCVYEPSHEWRNRFRSVRSHNTVVGGDKEQDEFVEKDIFRLKQRTQVQCTNFVTSDETDSFTGQLIHPQYTINRRIQFNKRKGILTIQDTIPSSDLPFYANLVLAPGCSPETIDIKTDGILSQSEGFYSPEYGLKIKTTCIHVKKYNYITLQ